MPPVGRNDPCPCGSGRKYKKCCWAKDAATPPPSPPGQETGCFDDLPFPKSVYEAVFEKFAKTDMLPGRLGWEEFDFEVDLFDPVLDALHDVFHTGKKGSKPDRERVAILEFLGMERHATAEMRSRLSDELERRTASIRDDETKNLARDALIALEDMLVHPVRVGFLRALYNRYILNRLLARDDFVKEDDKRLDPALVELSRKAGAQFEEKDISALHARLIPLGVDALPYIEHFTTGAWLHDAAVPIVELAGRLPGMRAACILDILSQNAETEAVEESLFAAMSNMPEQAWAILKFRALDPDEPFAGRCCVYPTLARAKAPDTLDILMDEMTRPTRWRDPAPKVELPVIAKWITQLDDRRAVGWAVHQIHDKNMSKAAQDAIREAYREKGWWTEVEEALDAARRGQTVLVPKGMKITEAIKDRLKRRRPDHLTVAQFDMSLLQQEWNQAYHEDLEWLRPCDLHSAGPREATLLQTFGREFAKHARQLGVEEGEATVQEMSAFQHTWLRTPREDLGGRVPLAVIHEEKRANVRNPAYEGRYMRHKVNDMFGVARQLLENGRTEDAKAQLRAVLAVEPDYLSRPGVDFEFSVPLAAAAGVHERQAVA